MLTALLSVARTTYCSSSHTLVLVTRPVMELGKDNNHRFSVKRNHFLRIVLGPKRAIAPYAQQLSHAWMLLLVRLCGLLLCVPVRNATSQRLLVDTVHGVKYVLKVRAVV